MRLARVAFRRAMNPYRSANSPPAALRARVSRFLRTRSLARFTVALLAGGAFASGWAAGRKPALTPVILDAPTPCATPPAVETNPADADQKAMNEAKARVPERTQPAAPTGYAMDPAQARASIAARAREVVGAITRRDLRAVAGFVDPDRGLSVGELGGATQATLTPAELDRCFADRALRVWSNASEAVTCGAYWNEHLAAPDFAHAPNVDYNLLSHEGWPAPMITEDDDQSEDPTPLAHRGAIVVQYAVRRPKLDKTEDDPPCDSSSRTAWSTLRLVFDPHGEQWKLTAVIWKDWST
jgi:hypothetical protein